jgi:hypothetical protein
LEAEARQHRGDGDWWRGSLHAAVTDLDRRHWAFSLVTAAHTSVVVNLQSELNTLVDELSPKHYAALRASLQAQGKLSTGRMLALADPLRLKQVTPSDRVLWLIRVLASEASVEQIDKKLSAKIAPLLRPGSGDMRDLVRIVTPRRINLNEFRGARLALPVGGWASSVKLGAISKASAEEILSEPDQWPGDVVQRAVEGIELRMAKGVPPLATVADANRWFD